MQGGVRNRGQRHLGNFRVATIFGGDFLARGVMIRTCSFSFLVPCLCRSVVITLVFFLVLWVCWSVLAGVVSCRVTTFVRCSTF